jgi:hypothetical protein
MYNLCHMIRCEDSQGIVGYDGKGDIKCGAIFDSWTVDACSAHFAITNPFVIRAGFLHECFRHLFIESGRERVFGLVPSTNAKALKLDKHLGFTEVARIPDAIADGVDYIVIRLDKRDCRWISEEYRRAA